MLPSTKKLDQQERNWLDLPSDVTANILERVGMVDILENAQKVCAAWRKICKDPAMWRVINMSDIDILRSDAIFSPITICEHAVDRSQGQLVDIVKITCYVIWFILGFMTFWALLYLLGLLWAHALGLIVC
ncbi:putative F-box domain-containing protein [Helianthus debilis subsp. tardiflorus]